MTDEITIDEKIQFAADIIARDCAVSQTTALIVARRLYDIWMKPGGEQRYIPAGEVAKKFRERYEADLTEAGIPLVDNSPRNPNPNGPPWEM